jgi:SAM-dependent methyltransferase
MLRRWLEHPRSRGLALDDPRTTAVRREIVRAKPFLNTLYREWYRRLAADLPATALPALELGAGAGFMAEIIPNLITSDVFQVDGVDRVLDACAPWPFATAGLRGVVMTNVFHHLPDIPAFLAEAARCVAPGGVISMIEPWITPWSRVVYTRLHHEPLDVTVTAWRAPAGGPLSGANGALPWIVVARDRQRLEQEFPAWHIARVQPLMPCAYLLSGGVSLRALAPGWLYGPVRAVEWLLSPLNRLLAMFAHITLVRRAEAKP